LENAAIEILRAVAEIGGTITGEHGVGLEKREAMRFIFTHLRSNRSLRKSKFLKDVTWY